MRRACLPLLWLLAALAAGGCAGREQRFDLIPGPLSIRTVWAGVHDPTGLGTEVWACIDAAQDEYLQQYWELLRREATPLVRAFRNEHGDGWRRDPTLMEGLASRQATLIDTLARLDEIFLTRIESCGVPPSQAARLRVDRAIELCRIVIEGHGAAILDLRALIDRGARTAAPPAVQEALDAYAVQLAALLPALRDAERSRLARQARALLRLEAEEQRLSPEERVRSDRLLKDAQAEAAQPVRRALATVLDLNARTVESLRAIMPAELYESIDRRFRETIDLGAGGATGDPAVVWQVELIAASPSLTPEARATVRDRLERFRERDGALRTRLVDALRRGEAVHANHPLRFDRSSLRTELLSATMGHLPKELADRLAAIRNVGTKDFDETVWAIAPGSAESLLARCPAGVRPRELEPETLLQNPDSVSALFLPTAANDLWLRTLLDRCGASTDARTVALQLWSDHAVVALRELERPMERVRELESALGPSLQDPNDAARAFDAYFAAIDQMRQLLTVIEERFFDELEVLLVDVDAPVRERLRLERRLERERIDWRFVPFAELLGYRDGAIVSAPLVLHATVMAPHERAIAEEVLRAHLPGLVSEASGFRGEGMALLRRLFVTLARVSANRGGDQEVRAALPAFAERSRSSVERHASLHRAVIDEVAAALPDRALELRRAWRRAAFPDLFLQERSIPPIVDFAERIARESPETRVAFEARRQRWREAIDRREHIIVEARRAANFERPPVNSGEVRDRLREWPEVAGAVALWNEEHARFLRDLALASSDPRLRALIDAWMRPAPPSGYWVAE